MLHRWETLTFLHWRFAPEAVQRLLPPGLRVETFDGDAWVGLVPFFMRVALPGTASVPWLSRFCETNVRTYVTDAAGRSGIWFFSLDAERAGAVVVARATYQLPYFWSAMSLERRGSTLRYRCRRRWPGRPLPESRVTVRVGTLRGNGAGRPGPLPHRPLAAVQRGPAHARRPRLARAVAPGAGRGRGGRRRPAAGGRAAPGDG